MIKKWLKAANKGSVILVVILSTIALASIGISGNIAARRQVQMNNSAKAFRDIKIIVEGCNSFYSEYLSDAGSYIGFFNPINRDSARENTIKLKWDTQNTAGSLTKKEETMTNFIKRTGINFVQGDISSSNFYKSVTVTTQVDGRHNKWTDLSYLPESWSIKITILTKGPKDFSVNELKRLLGKYGNYLRSGNSKAGQGITVSFKELKPNEVTIVIYYRIASEQSIIMSM